MCPSSPAWGHGLWHGTIAPLALGVTIAAYAGPFDAERLMRALQDYGISNLSAAATHYRMMKNAGTAERYRFALDKLSFTGEPIDGDTAAWAERTFGRPVCSMYGTTEVGVILAMYPGAADLPARPGALGKPVPGVELAVLDAKGEPCPPGTVGEIMLRRGDGWFPTKDLGHTDADGYFYHDGRADDVIISAGWTMSAVEIEDVLLKHADVREVAVIGVPDAERGQVPKAFVVSARAGDEAFTAELQALAQQRLSRHEYPRRVAFVDALPRTPAGKVNRKALREREQDNQQDNRDARA
jgi:acetyl-CoA synthetase